MHILYKLRGYAVVSIGIALFISAPTNVLAATEPENQKLVRIVHELMSRVEALEKKVEYYERIDRSTNANQFDPKRNFSLAALEHQKIQSENVELAGDEYFAETEGADQNKSDGWSGIYWGASYGASATRSRSTFESRTVITGTNPNQGLGGLVSFSPNNIGPTTSNWLKHDGASVDVFIGLNQRLGSSFLAGVQLEGSSGQIAFGSTLLNARWMTSVLARGGWLVDDTTLLYGLAGWTYGHFGSSQNYPLVIPDEFEAHGLTVGGGLEKKLADNWSIRAEYRFTEFEDKNFSRPSPFGLSQTFGLGGGPIYETTFYQELENKMHTGRIGISYLLSTSE